MCSINDQSFLGLYFDVSTYFNQVGILNYSLYYFLMKKTMVYTL